MSVRSPSCQRLEIQGTPSMMTGIWQSRTILEKESLNQQQLLCKWSIFSCPMSFPPDNGSKEWKTSVQNHQCKGSKDTFDYEHTNTWLKDVSIDQKMVAYSLRVWINCCQLFRCIQCQLWLATSEPSSKTQQNCRLSMKSNLSLKTSNGLCNFGKKPGSLRAFLLLFKITPTVSGRTGDVPHWDSLSKAHTKSTPILRA